MRVYTWKEIGLVSLYNQQSIFPLVEWLEIVCQDIFH